MIKGSKLISKITALILLVIMTLSISSVGLALCKYSKSEVKYTNRKICNKACGFTGLFAKQDSWTETITYYCNDGTKEYKTINNRDAANCC